MSFCAVNKLLCNCFRSSPFTMAQSILNTMPGASTGTVVVTEPLNFWGGKRVKPMQEKNAEPVFEPATGNYNTNESAFSFCAMKNDTGVKYRSVCDASVQCYVTEPLPLDPPVSFCYCVCGSTTFHLC